MIEQVMTTLKQELKTMNEKFQSFPWENEQAYRFYLAQTFKYVEHSCKLIEYSANKIQKGDLYDAMIHHIEEEKGHELIAENDLKFFGDTHKNYSELAITKEIYDIIYHELDTLDPVAPLLGYAMALEGMSADSCPMVAEKLEKAFGKKANRFIALHGVVDQEHAEESVDTLKLLNNDQLKLVEKSIKDSCKRYLKFLDDVKSNIPQTTKQAS